MRKDEMRAQAKNAGWLTRRRALGLTAGFGAAATMAACGAKKSSSTTTTSKAGQLGKPKYGGALNVAIAADFFDYDASLGGKSNPNGHLIKLAYNTLIRARQGAGEDYNATILDPSLADRWESPDAQTYTFHLNKGVKFANLPPVNGRGMTSADVKWSFEYWARIGQFGGKRLPKSNYAFTIEGLDRVETPDPYTAVMVFKDPFAPFLNYATTPGLVIVAHEIFDADGSFSKRIVGTGPFMLDTGATQRGARWVLKKNPDYWEQGKPYVDEVHCLVFSDDATISAGFQTKQIDTLAGSDFKIDIHSIDQIRKNNPDAILEQYQKPITQALYVNDWRPPFNDTRMRHAFSMALDRDEFDKTFADGKGTWVSAEGEWPGDFTQAEIHQMLKFDPAQAAQLVSAAGYPNGVTVEYMIREGNLPLPQAELLQSQLKKVGINMTIKNVDKATGSKRLHTKDFDITLGGQGLDGDQDGRLYGYYSTSTSNYSGVQDPKLDALILAERREADPVKRKQAIRDTLRYMAENALSMVMFRPIGASFWQPYLKNYSDNWEQDDWNAANIWLEK